MCIRDSLERRAASGDLEAAQRVSVPHLGPAQHAAMKAKKKTARLPSWVRQRISEARELAKAFTELRAAEKAYQRLARVKEAIERSAPKAKPPKRRDRGHEI